MTVLTEVDGIVQAMYDVSKVRLSCLTGNSIVEGWRCNGTLFSMSGYQIVYRIFIQNLYLLVHSSVHEVSLLMIS